MAIIKRYKYRGGEAHFSWAVQDASGDENTDTMICIKMKTILDNGEEKEKTYYRTIQQVEAFYIPLIRIAFGIDSLSSALLYCNDDHAKGIMLRMIEQGTDFISFKGIYFDENGKWRLNQ
jgi:hypothetical protein